jgi:hypothetical protein
METKVPQLPPKDRGVVREIWVFMRVRKKYWLAPIILAMVLLGLLMFVAAQSHVVAPFIYAL